MSVVADIIRPQVEEADQVVAEPALSGSPQPEFHRLTVDQYHVRLRHGILGENDDIELLDGLLIAKMTKSTAHNVAKLLVQRALAKVIPEGWFIDSQDAITLAKSEPETDVVVVRGDPRDYFAHYPRPGDLGLIVEVSDSSLRHDQRTKKAIYAEAAIPIYWIVNVIDRRIELYAEPTGAYELRDYTQRQEFHESDQVPVVIAGREVGRIPVRELLP